MDNEQIVGKILDDLHSRKCCHQDLAIHLRNMIILSNGHYIPLGDCRKVIDSRYPDVDGVPLEVLEALTAIHSGNEYPKIKMIKHLRNEMKMGLRESKQWIEDHYAF